MLIEGIFMAVCAGLCGALTWAATNISEPFYLALCVFSAAFWGSLAAFCIWGRISEAGRKREQWTPTIIWPRKP